MLSQAAAKKADEAKRQNKWLYDPEYKFWYSPEDFKHTYHYANASDELLARIQIIDPHEGIAAGFQRLKEIYDKLHGLVTKVSEYYKK